jgi:DNA-binding NarL/FixJ family response regulator
MNVANERRTTQRGRTVLLVDDNPDLRFLTRLNLDDAPCEIVGEATNGVEAVSAVENLRPDVVIMDMKMPLMDGLEATKQIKARFPETEIIIVSGSDDPAMMRRILAAGATASVDKTKLDALGDKLERRRNP